MVSFDRAYATSYKRSVGRKEVSTYTYRKSYSYCGGEMLHLLINSRFIYYVIILLLDKIQDIILITIYLIREIIWEN